MKNAMKLFQCGNWFKITIVTGARCVATLLHEMKRRGKDCRFGVVSMCIGVCPTLTLHQHSPPKKQNTRPAFSLPLIYGCGCKHVYLLEYVVHYMVICNWNAGTGMGAAAVFERGDAVDEFCNARKVDSDHHLLSKDAR